MAIADYFLQPLGLAALASVIPLIILYFLKPKPSIVELPTMRFLFEDERDDQRSAVLEALQRDWLLLVQLLILVMMSLAVAAPYIAVAEERVVDERVIVVDGSASMAAESAGATRFTQAVRQAQESVSGTTSIVVAGAIPNVALRNGPTPAARETLDTISVSHASGDLAAAIARATAIGGDGATIVVISDFVDQSDWRATVATARARGFRVRLQSVGGPVENVGVTDVAYRSGTVTATIENFGTQRASRTVTLGSRSTDVTLDAGDSTSVQLAIPAGGGDLRLVPSDGFPVDDRMPIAAPSEPTIEVLLLTNDENRFLTTALSLMDDVELTTARPPTTISRQYDVIIFSNVDPENVLPGNIQTAKETLRRGGGVAIQSQSDLGAINYGGLLLIEPAGLANGSTVTVVDESLTRGITFAPPERYVTGSLQDGRALVTTPDGTPIIATATREGGNILYYGFIEDASGFKYNYKYPVFWQRAIFQLAGRQSLESLNHQTGTRLQVGADQPVQAPNGERTGPTVLLDQVGFYTVTDQRYGAALLDRSESNITPPTVSDTNTVDGGTRIEEQTVPVKLTPLVAAVALGIGLLELILLRRRGDL